MEEKRLIDALRICADDDIICPDCELYEKGCDGSFDGVAGLMLKAADRLELQDEKIKKPLSSFLAPVDCYKGLKRKFLVFRSDTGEMIENCFVLRPDKDNAAVAALRAYAEATENSTLSDDIFNWVGKKNNEPLTLEELRKMDGEPVWDNFLMEWCIVMKDLCRGKGAVKYFDGGFNQLSEKRFYRNRPEEIF